MPSYRLGITIHTSDAEAQAAANVSSDDDEVEAVLKHIPSIEQLRMKGLKMVALEFEKVMKLFTKF